MVHENEVINKITDGKINSQVTSLIGQITNSWCHLFTLRPTALDSCYCSASRGSAVCNSVCRKVRGLLAIVRTNVHFFTDYLIILIIEYLAYSHTEFII